MKTLSIKICLVSMVLGFAVSKADATECTPPAGYNACFKVDITDDKSDNNLGDGKCKSGPDDASCTLRAAIEQANQLAPAQISLIQLPKGNYPISNGQLNIKLNAQISLKGEGANNTKILGSGRILQVGPDANFDIDGVNLYGGQVINNNGGGIYNVKGAILTLKNCKFESNEVAGKVDKDNNNIVTLFGSRGGAIYNDQGTVDIENCEFSSNSAYKANLANNANWSPDEKQQAADLVVASGRGGAIYSNEGILNIRRSIFYGNFAESGAVVFGFASTTLIENSTITNNSSNTGGMIDSSHNFNRFDLSNITINEGSNIALRNDDGGGLYIKNSILVGICNGTVTSQGYNLVYVQTGTCDFTQDATNLVGDNQGGIDPIFGDFQKVNSSWVYPLDAGSPAIDAANPAGCTDKSDNPLLTDQTGFARPTGAQGRCDIGAVEMGCGNNIKEVGELCEDGNLIDGDNCDSTCKPTGCGSGAITGDEECDDGNLVDGDGCDHLCKLEESATGGGSATGGSATGGQSGDGGGGCGIEQSSQASAWVICLFALFIFSVFALVKFNHKKLKR